MNEAGETPALPVKPLPLNGGATHQLLILKIPHTVRNDKSE
jgi:hypothetical protein